MIRNIKNAGIAGGIAAILFSAGFVFAQGIPANVGHETPRQPSVGTPSVNAPQSVLARWEQGQARAVQQREKANQRVAEIRDKIKQRIAAHLVVQFDHINKVWTDHFAQMLTRYDAILQKIQDRANIAASNGKDVSAVTAAIQTAKTTIASALSAVETQAAKTYTIDASTAAKLTTATPTPEGQRQLMQSLRLSFQTLRDQLFHDLFALRNGPMANVRKAEQDALKALGQIPGVDRENATPTPVESGSKSHANQ